MADWHVYLLTTDVTSSAKTFDKGASNEVVFTVTDNDTGDPIEGATVTLTGVAETTEGTTDAEGNVTLTFTPTKPKVKATIQAEGFNPRTKKYRAR